MMPTPLLALLGPMVIAAVILLTGRWAKVSAISGSVLLAGLALWLSQIDLISRDGGPFSGDTMIFLERSFTMSPPLQQVLVVVYGFLALSLLCAVVLSHGLSFNFVSVLALVPLSAALMVNPPIFGAILLLIAAGLIAILIQGARPESTLSALRYLTMTILASATLLIAGWMIASDQATFLSTTPYLFLIAFAILLAGFPFHIWIGPMVNESRALVPAFVAGLAQLLIVLFCLALLQNNPTIGGNLEFVRLLRGSGMAGAVIAALLALTAESYGRLLGYVLLSDIGFAITALSFPGAEGAGVTLTIVVLRSYSLIIAGVGLGLMRQHLPANYVGTGNIPAGKGLAWKTPLGTSLYIFGGLSLAGAPLTPGFFGRWSTVAMMAGESSWQAILLVLAMTACGYAIVRSLLTLFEGERPKLGVGKKSELRSLRATLAILLLVALLLAIFPQILLNHVTNLVELL